MPFFRHILMFGLLVCAALLGARAQEAAPAPETPEAPDAASAKGSSKLPREMSKDLGIDIKPADLLAMERFLSMPPDKMREIIRALEKIAALSDEERAQLVDRMRTFRMMDEEKRHSLFFEFKNTSPRDRDLVRRYLQSLPKEDKQKVRDQMNNLKGPERLAIHKELVEKAKAAGLEPNPDLSDVPGDDMPKNFRRGGGPPQIPGPSLPPPPTATPAQLPQLPAGVQLPSVDEAPPAGEMP